MNTVLVWSLPDEKGSPITDYEIKIQAASLDMIVSSSCDGSIIEVVQSRECRILYKELLEQPFNLVLGNEVIFTVRGKNEIGWSPFSITPTIKDLIRTVPLSPLTQVTEGLLTDDSQLHIEW